MKLYTTQVWDFKTAYLEGKTKCKICGKPIRKRFSVQYREDSAPEMNRLKERKELWESEEHICNACLRKNMIRRGEVKQYDFSEIAAIIEDIGSLKCKLEQAIEPFKHLRGKVVLYNNEEFEISSVSYELEQGIILYCYKINKQSPWCVTNQRMQFFLDNTGYYQVAKIDDLVFTDEVFSDRAKMLCEWEKENADEKVG